MGRVRMGPGTLAAAALLAAWAPAVAQRNSGSVDALLDRARKEIREFERGGGKRDDPKHPVEKWVRELWRAHEAAPQSADGGKAASEVVHLLVHVDRFAEVSARAGELGAQDLAWRGLPQVLFEAATMQKERLLYQVLHLGAGQPAPEFAAETLDGGRVSLAEFRGKPVVITFWGAGSGECRAEVPLLQQLYWKYGASGVAWIGVSLDDDVAAARKVIAEKRIPWPQICDGKGEHGEIAKLYNVDGVPVTYVIDRAGRIAARLTSGTGLEAMIFEAAVSETNWERTERDTWQRPARVMEELGIKAGSSVADIGAGGGYFTARLAARVGPKGKVLAEDLDAGPLVRVREMKLPQVETVVGTEDDPRLGDGTGWTIRCGGSDGEAGARVERVHGQACTAARNGDCGRPAGRTAADLLRAALRDFAG